MAAFNSPLYITRTRRAHASDRFILWEIKEKFHAFISLPAHHAAPLNLPGNISRAQRANKVATASFFRISLPPTSQVITNSLHRSLSLLLSPSLSLRIWTYNWIKTFFNSSPQTRTNDQFAHRSVGKIRCYSAFNLFFPSCHSFSLSMLISIRRRGS